METTVVERPAMTAGLGDSAHLARLGRIADDVMGQQRYPVPAESHLNGEYTEAPDLEALAASLIGQHRLTVAAQARITYLWRDKSTKAKGKLVLGKCQLATGLVRHFADTEVVIWLAADALREMGATHKQVEAALYHELLHLSEAESDGPTNVPGGELIVAGHDYEGFFSELTVYGAWRPALTGVVNAVRQLTLDLRVP